MLALTLGRSGLLDSIRACHGRRTGRSRLAFAHRHAGSPQRSRNPLWANLEVSKGAFLLGAIPRDAPALTPARRSAATATFLAAIGLARLVLWNAQRLASLQPASAAGGVLAMPWLAGWIAERGEAVHAMVCTA